MHCHGEVHISHILHIYALPTLLMEMLCQADSESCQSGRNQPEAHCQAAALTRSEPWAGRYRDSRAAACQCLGPERVSGRRGRHSYSIEADAKSLPRRS